MRILLQRVINASVTIDNNLKGSIDKGLLLLVGFTNNDNEEIIDKMIKKIINLRIFEDENNKMNLSLIDINGSILSISQFTLYANTNNGRRPSFEESLNYNEANNLYDVFNNKLKEQNINIETGIFGADMKINLINDGPVK
jgi:D-tyrosyl-tRNA(Tyr) deacylase